MTTEVELRNDWSSATGRIDAVFQDALRYLIAAEDDNIALRQQIIAITGNYSALQTQAEQLQKTITQQLATIEDLKAQLHTEDPVALSGFSYIEYAEFYKAVADRDIFVATGGSKGFLMGPNNSAVVRLSSKTPVDENNKIRFEFRPRDLSTTGNIIRVDPKDALKLYVADFTIPAGWKSDKNKILLFQVHHSGSAFKSVSPPFEIMIWNKTLRIRTRGAGSTAPTEYTDRFMYDLDLSIDNKIRLTAAIQWGFDGNLRVCMAHNGVQIEAIPLVHAPIGYDWSDGSWPSWGLYWPGASERPADYPTEVIHAIYYYEIASYDVTQDQLDKINLLTF